MGRLNLLTDPVFSQRAFPVQWAGPRRVMDPGLALDALPPLDVILLSHNHYDHFDRPGVKWIAKAHPRTTWVVPLGLGRYIRGWGARDIPEFNEIGARCGPFDLGMIPIGAYDPRWFMERVHADPEEAVRIYEDLIAPHPAKPRPLMLGIHWGTFRLTDEPMDEPPRRTVARRREAGLDEERLWIARFGETRRVTS